MGGSSLKIAVLTSSRADYSIYYPLLKKLKEDEYFLLDVIAFGTHLSDLHGHTIDEIVKDGFEVQYEVDSLTEGDDPTMVSKSMGQTMQQFSAIWENEKYDLIFALGDRYEMFAAVMSSVPFNIKIAHIHGGETTLGAIDNVFRHAITMAATYHFCTTAIYADKIASLTGSKTNIFDVGSLSIDNLRTLQLQSKDEFYDRFNIRLSEKSILITFHPETVSTDKNEQYVRELIAALQDANLVDFQKIITMPNSDTKGLMIRNSLLGYVETDPRAIAVENFGTTGYLSCMKHCSFLLGNSSSGFTEASFFPKHVINIGQRQQGRIMTPNIENCEIEKFQILQKVKELDDRPYQKKINTYGDGHAARKIVNILKSI